MSDSLSKQCSQCRRILGASCFSWRDGGKQSRLTSRCHECRRRNYKENPERARQRSKDYYWSNREEIKRRQRERRNRNLAAALVADAKKRALKRNIPFGLCPSDIVVPDTCPILGLPLVVNRGRCGPNSPTLDRIIPDVGYVPGNVQVISHRANTIKSDATADELEAVARYIRNAAYKQLGG